MNLVEAYNKLNIFPFHKILHWSIRVENEGNEIPVGLYGSRHTTMLYRERTQIVRLHIMMNDITDEDVNTIVNMRNSRHVLKDIRVKNSTGTVRIREGVIENVEHVPDNWGLFSQMCEIVIRCEGTEMIEEVRGNAFGGEQDDIYIGKYTAGIFRNHHMGHFI